MVPRLGRLDPFPPVAAARDELGGLLAVGGDLSTARLLDAYLNGIFPWGTCEGYPLWYSPDPRMVLFPAEYRPSRSLRKALRSGRQAVRLDTDFPAVIAACAAVRRPGQDGTWIDDTMMESYIRLHELGWAHSVETWKDGELVGGLYGLAIGRMFYGESMFARVTDGSKIALAYLVAFLRSHGVTMIDCQQETGHLASLGAAPIARAAFLEHVRAAIGEPAIADWTPVAPL